MSPLDDDQLERRAVRPPGRPPVSSPACDTFLALAVTSRLYRQPVTFIEAGYRRYLDKDPGALAGG